MSHQAKSLLGSRGLEFWEEDTRPPPTTRPSNQALRALEIFYSQNWEKIRDHPFQKRREIRRQQLQRLRELVRHAYDTVPFYHNLYKNSGISPNDIKTFDDFSKLPIVRKEDLQNAGIAALSYKFNQKDLFATRSSGSSGNVLRIYVNLDSIVKDTVQGIRQFWLQSSFQYSANHLLTHIYTVPWWFDSVQNNYKTAFISSLMKTGKIANILDELQSHIVSLYPTNLQNLLNHPGFNGLQEHSYLCVVHSEISTKAQRNGWSDKLGFPVFDEYSSEELTRIALELPCGHYHVHDDSVYAEILDEATNEVASSGETGLFVGTNLMNEAMPFIRYVQGDHCMKESDDSECDCGWSRLGPIQGRENDSFITIDGRLIPAGTLLDLTYRWMFDSGINPKGFEFIQKTRDRVIVNIWPILDESSTKKISEYIRAYVKVLIGNNCTVEVNTLNSRPDRNGKFRPIRREFTIN